MLSWIFTLGGLLIMMGQHDRSEALFYYFRVEDQVPENHLLRLIDKHVSFAFVRERLKPSYSETGRPSIDPELLLRILLIGYLYGITSERKLVEELRMHLAWRWFTGLGFDQEIPHHSTFSKNRHGRYERLRSCNVVVGVGRYIFNERTRRKSVGCWVLVALPLVFGDGILHILLFGEVGRKGLSLFDHGTAGWLRRRFVVHKKILRLYDGQNGSNGRSTPINCYGEGIAWIAEYIHSPHQLHECPPVCRFGEMLP
jgi:transposase